jgi:D-hexose-6-phosphate mutarotase
VEGVVVEAGAGGLERVRVEGARAEAHIYLQGATVTHFQPRGAAPVLFLSNRAAWASGRAIRGGIPLIFPWFGAHASNAKAPTHGFARTSAWRLVDSRTGPDGAVIVELGLEDDEVTRAVWPHAFQLRYHVSVGETLGLSFEVTSASSQPFQFEDALHTYLAVGDVRAVAVTGLENTTYVDKVDFMSRKRQGTEPLRLTGETDRVFLGTRGRCVVEDRVLARRLLVDKTGSATTVVWNPWSTKAAGIADLEPDDWRRMVCVETANAADDAVTLGPGQRHVMTATIRVDPEA